MADRIEDYALVGDCETAALISRNGSIDWLCWPAFDSEACFAALLGHEGNGCWTMAPAAEVKARSRRYLPDSMVLETRLETASGAVVLTDFMPVRNDASDLIRLVRCEEGEVEMRSTLALRFDYGKVRPWLVCDDAGAVALAGPHGVRLETRAPVTAQDGDCRSAFVLKAGETVSFALSYFPSHRRPPSLVDVEADLRDTLRYWREWAGRCGYAGPRRETVVRSLLTLKALTYKPTGGLVAAPTSSIPEGSGGARNWDYRFCWLRDATFTLLSFLQAGYNEEAASWRDWLLRAAAGAPEDLQPVYSLAGHRRLTEWRADWLDGFGGAKPVRFGNAAADQRQLDIYGEVVDVLHQAERFGVTMTGWERSLEEALIRHVERTWREPDQGIWEVRGGPQRFTHSQVMAWVAVDRGIKSAEAHGGDAPVEAWRRLREEMHAEICREAYNPDIGAFVQAFGSRTLDASVLLIPHLGFLPADDPRMVGTVEAVRRRLSDHGFLRRYAAAETDDGLEGDEAPFLACSFWLVDNLVMQGRKDEAEGLFETLLGACNDLGLLAEEYDPRTGRSAGNFPQALSHMSLVTTALNLSGWGPAQQRSEEG